jgi:calmodulin
MRSLGQSPDVSDVQSMIAEILHDGNDTVDFPEFLSMMARRKHSAPVDQLDRALFNRIDSGGRGFLLIEDLQSAVSLLGVPLDGEEVVAMFHSVDVDGDSRVTFAEFSTMLHQNNG